MSQWGATARRRLEILYLLFLRRPTGMNDAMMKFFDVSATRRGLASRHLQGRTRKGGDS